MVLRLPNNVVDAVGRFAHRLGSQVARLHVIDQRTSARLTAVARLQNRSTARTVIVKAFQDGRGLDATRKHRLIAERLQRCSLPGVSVPKLLWFDESAQVAIIEHAEGQRLDRIDYGEAFLTALTDAGRALATLHTAPPLDIPERTLRDRTLDRIRPNVDMLLREFPSHADSVHDWLEILLHEQLTDRHTASIVHSDYQLRNVFWCPTRAETISVIDWDDLASGEAEFDVAYMICYLRCHMPPSIANASAIRFLRGYASIRRFSFHRFPLYVAFNLLRRSVRRVQLRDQGWRHEVGQMLNHLRSVPDHSVPSLP